MGQASSSSSAATGINAPGGSISKNSPSVLIFGIAAIAVMVWLWLRRKR